MKGKRVIVIPEREGETQFVETESTQKRPLSGQTPYQLRAGISYTDKSLHANILFNRSERQLFLLGENAYQHEYRAPFNSVEASISYRFPKSGIWLKLSGSNLLNVTQIFYTNTPDDYVRGVMPAYNAEQTLERTYSEIPFDIVDEVILTDDGSNDNTLKVAEELGIRDIQIHVRNRGYGGNQKTCYNRALELNADIIIMLHPDYQYTPKLIASMAYLIANGVYPVVFASRILGKGAIKGGMPLIKYIANRALTFFQNILLNQKLSEYHTGYRAFSAEVLRNINFNANSDDFIFDQ